MADKAGLKNEEFLKKIQEKGSTALKGRNPFGVNVFSGSVTDDGVVSGKVTKTKYNNQELVKSVDTNIFELLPPELPPEPDVVPRPIYNEALARISELEIDVENLNVQVSDLTALVNDLRITTQSLRIDLDSKDLLVASVENRNQQNIEQTQGSIFDLQNSIQRATSEAIERTSLEAVNTAVIEQNNALNAQLEQLQNRLVETQNELTRQQQISDIQQEEGAFSNNEITVSPQINDQNEPPITWRGRPSPNFFGVKQWDKVRFFINGKTLIIFNPNEESVAVTVRQSGFFGKKPFGNILPFTVQAGDRFTLTLQPDLGEMGAISNRTSGSERVSGALIFTTPDGGSFEIPAEVQIQRGRRFEGDDTERVE